MGITWQGEGVDEVGVDESGRVLVEVDPRYFRPSEVDSLVADPSKARAGVGWEPKVSFEELVERMVETDLRAVEALS